MYRISILLRPDGFSFCAYRPSDRQVQMYRNYEIAGAVPAVTDAAAWEVVGKTYAGVFREDEWLQQTYASCDVYSDFPLSTLVPSAFADPDLPDLYFRPCADGLAVQMAFHSEPLASGMASVFFGVPVLWETLWQSLSLPAVRWHHLTTGLVERLQRQAEGCRMQLSLTAGHVAVLLHDSVRGMLHHQTYEAGTATDVLYYALGALQLHGVAPDDCEVSCLSTTTRLTAGEVCGMLRPYFGVVSSLTDAGMWQVPPFDSLNIPQ